MGTLEGSGWVSGVLSPDGLGWVWRLARDMARQSGFICIAHSIHRQFIVNSLWTLGARAVTVNINKGDGEGEVVWAELEWYSQAPFQHRRVGGRG